LEIHLFLADTDATRKQEAASLMHSFMANAEHLANRINPPPSPSFKDVPMTPTIPKSSPPQILPFRFEIPASQSRNETPTLNASSTTSIKSFDASPDNDNPWNNNTVQSNDIVSNSSSVLGEPSVVSPTRAYPQIGLNVTNVQADNISPFKWENDEDVHDCRKCHKKFGIWIRRHHCRFVQNVWLNLK
jgi:hypothetical protein